MALYLGIALVASVFLAVGLVMMKSRGERLPQAHGAGTLRAILAWVRDPVWLGGLGLETVGYALYIAALSGAPVSLVAIVMQGGIALFVAAAVVFLGERARPAEWLGVVAFLGAMTLLGFSLEGAAPQGALDTLALVPFSAVALGGSAALLKMERRFGEGLAPAIVAGVAAGMAGLYTKALTETFWSGPQLSLLVRVLVNPYVYLTIFANLVGLVLLQNTFNYARGMIVVPLSAAFSNVVPILGGMIAFGEGLPPSPRHAAMRIAAFALTVTASALLASVQVAQSG